MRERIFSQYFETEKSREMRNYLANGGYRASRKALLDMTPAAVLEEVRKAELRGRGGAGFPAGIKWSFMPKSADKIKYLCVNADEGEPGTFKDRFLLDQAPHLLLEGMIIASYAVGSHAGFIYVRGEYERLARRLEEAIDEAVEAGCLGKNIHGSGFDVDVFVHRGAGAYICGEETALLESLEGRRGHPRLKPPFPTSAGLFGCPTVINNVETLCDVPFIIDRGADQFVKLGLPRDGGTRLFSVSGSVLRPGLYELPVGTNLRELVFVQAGGLKDGARLKAVIPGGLSAPLLTASEIDVAMDVDSLIRAGSMLGSAGVIVIDDSVPIVDVLQVIARFYDHESCGQCTPCRAGTAWIHKIVERIVRGDGESGDLDEILRLASGLKGKTLCPMGDAAALPMTALVNKFRNELEIWIADSKKRH